MRFAFDIAVAFVVAVVAGVWSAWVAVDHAPLFNALRAGPWVAWPRAASADADPYDLAAAARSDDLPLGAAEGLTFTAAVDDAGDALTGSCSYAIHGRVPTARVWSLTAHESSERPAAATTQRVGLHSREILRDADGSFSIALAPRAEPGNWLPVSDGQRFVVMLRLYDTPLTSSARPTTITMPSIRKTGCP